jgi:hypothetical protein
VYFTRTIEVAPLAAVFGEWVPRTHTAWAQPFHTMQFRAPHLRLLCFVDQHWSPLSQSVMTVTAPVPLFRRRHQTADNGIAMRVTQGGWPSLAFLCGAAMKKAAPAFLLCCWLLPRGE